VSQINTKRGAMYTPGMLRWPTLVWLSAVALALSPGCAPVTAESSSARASVAKPFPESIAQAQELRQSGVSWSNEQVRAHYHRLIEVIPRKDAQWKQEGVSTEERARRAFQIRHDARLTTRAMMSSAWEVELLRKRDLEKYGNPDGPTFEQLVIHQQKKGLSGDSLYEAIIESAQRTADDKR
jgi:hypothetical protein